MASTTRFTHLAPHCAWRSASLAPSRLNRPAPAPPGPRGRTFACRSICKPAAALPIGVIIMPLARPARGHFAGPFQPGFSSRHVAQLDKTAARQQAVPAFRGVSAIPQPASRDSASCAMAGALGDALPAIRFHQRQYSPLSAPFRSVIITAARGSRSFYHLRFASYGYRRALGAADGVRHLHAAFYAPTGRPQVSSARR